MAEVTSITRDRRLTDEEAAKYRALREQALREKPELHHAISEGLGPSGWEDLQELLAFVRGLRAERLRQGMTCEEVADRALTPVEVIQNLEAERELNPSLTVLSRYARALGQRLTLTLAVESSAPPIVALPGFPTMAALPTTAT